MVASSDLIKLARRIGEIESHLGKGTPLTTVASAVASGAATPFKGDVVSMSASKKGGSGHAIPVAVPGNEAEELHPQEEQPLLLPAPSNVVDLHPTADAAFKPTTDDEIISRAEAAAANDEGPTSEEDEVETYIAYDDTLDYLAESMGYSHEQARRRLLSAYKADKKHCLAKHGQTLATVRLARLERNRNYAVGREDCYIPAPESGFKAWSRGLPVLLQKAMQNPVAQARAELQRKQDIKPTLRGAKFYRNVAFRAMEQHVHAPAVATTTALQLRAWRLWWNDKADSIRRRIGMSTPNRALLLRSRYSNDPDWNGREFQPIFRKWTTVRTSITGTGGWWVDGVSLEKMDIRTRMDKINRELIRRNMATHGDVAAMTGHLLSFYAELGDTVTVND
jgi:hypothetical protein